MERGYCWLHLPSGKAGVRVHAETYPGELYELCDKWNRNGQGTWQYWVL